MKDSRELLKKLISAPGLSAYETPVRLLIEEAWRPLTDELRVNRIGSLQARKRGSGDEPRPSILIAAHMDAIGLMVTRIVDEFLYFTEIGGIDDRILPGQLVTVHGREDLPAVIAQPPAWLLSPEEGDGVVPMESLVVDTGLTPRQVSRLVRVGDLISFAQPPLEMGKDYLVGHSLDNRASVAALTHCLKALQNRSHGWDVWAVATSQEEETLGGAATSAYELRPQLAVAVDVTFGSGPGTSGYRSVDMDKGPVLGWGPNIHPGLHKAFKEAAERIELEVQTEVMPRHSGTDAIALQVTSEGIPTMVLSIPLRYMHTPVEMVNLKNVVRAGRLLAEFIVGLEDDFLSQLTWDEEE